MLNDQMTGAVFRTKKFSRLRSRECEVVNHKQHIKTSRPPKHKNHEKTRKHTKNRETTQKIQKTQIRTREPKNNSYKKSELVRRKRFYKKTTSITFLNSNHFTNLDQVTGVEMYFFIEKKNTKNPQKTLKNTFQHKISIP